MTERWNRLERLYHDAAALAVHERGAFLDAACGDDAELRRELAQMLEHAHTGFLDNAPAWRSDASLTGRRLGVYEVHEKVGQGGMGEVYRATDTTLHRDVAIKVLPPEWLADPGRRMRFEREARTLASLNHPNIANVFELDVSSGISALVMELVEGETLRERIAAGRIPVPEAIELAIQMAEGLEAAHEAGVVHRDFKPENVKFSRAGAVKILDFGIATVDARRVSIMSATGPTVEADVAGTTAYMSPEQARGKATDRRTDIWAFGCVLYEMLTGLHAFTGDTRSDTLAAILDRDPDWTRLEASQRPLLIQLVRRCLRKDPRQRLRDIGDAVLELRAIAEAGLESSPAERRAPRWLVFVSVAAVGAVAAVVLLTVNLRRGSTALPRTNLAIPLPSGIAHPADGAEIAIAPDGRSVAYAGADATGHARLFLQPLDSPDERPLKNTDDARYPFFSPDGKWLAFWSKGQIKKVSIPDGVAQPMCSSDIVTRDAEWSDDGTILFAERSDAPAAGILRTSADCAPPEILTRPDRAANEVWHFAPHRIPGSAAVLFSVRRNLPTGAGHRVMVLPAPGQQPRVLLEDAWQARYLGGGVLLFQRGPSVFATRLDLTTWTTSGTRLIVDNVQGDATGEPWSFAQDVFVYEPSTEAVRTFSWVTRDGAEQPLRLPPRRYYAPKLSPSGDKIAVEIQTGSDVDVWIYDIGRDTLQRATYDGLSRYPEWTPDGTRITVGRRRAGALDTYWFPADGSSPPELLKRNETTTFVVGWTRDLRTMLYSEPSRTGSDLRAFERATGATRPLIDSAATEYAGRLSPDERSLAYLSNASGAFEVWMTTFPSLTGRRQLTTGGAREPLWSGDGRELFYRKGDQVFSIPIESTDPIVAGRPRAVFQGPYFQPLGPGIRSYDVTPDGQRFLMMRAAPASPPMLRVVQGFRPPTR